jgi:predicted transcriptional regulator of viral defense system
VDVLKTYTDLQDCFKDSSALGVLDLVNRGVPRWRVLYAAKTGRLERIARGLYALPESEPSEAHALAVVAHKARHAAICLLSALRFHQLTTTMPHEVWIAVKKGARKPAIAYPPVRVMRFAADNFDLGLETHRLEGASVRIYSVTRTVVDLFRYRNKVGLDVALEALREGWKERRFTIAEVEGIAGRLRMSKVMRPYLQSLAAHLPSDWNRRDSA